MQLPPDDGGLDLGDAPLLPDAEPDEGQELPGLPDDDMLAMCSPTTLLTQYGWKGT